MKKLPSILILVSSLLMFCTFSFAQQTGKLSNGALVKISGSVVDGETKSPMEFATVMLRHKADSAKVTGAVTDSEGNFRLHAKAGNYLLEVSFLGYEKLYVHDINPDGGQPTYVVEQVQLKTKATTLDEVDIVADKSRMEFALDKKNIQCRTGSGEYRRECC